jgi:hypothetical protein
VSKVEEIERIIEQLPAEDFEKLSAWMDLRRRGKKANVYPGPTETKTVFRDHSAFLSGYSPEDEGIYDDAGSR